MAHESFIHRWNNREGGQERANYATFLLELCDVLNVAHPDPASATHEDNDYVFERRVQRHLADGKLEAGRIDLYKRNAFILEAKQSRDRTEVPLKKQRDLFIAPPVPKDGTTDHFMIQARRQAERYVAALPTDHAAPPFLIVCDIGRSMELYADFSGYGRHYTQFPDARRFRITLDQLADPDIRTLLKTVWEAPHSLDPAHKTAKVTRDIAAQLAILSKALEGRGFEAGTVALFLMRCLFTMFVEDIGLLRENAFTDLLEDCLKGYRQFCPEIDDLWRHMDKGTYSPGVGERLLRFNGKLFKNAQALPLTEAEIRLLKVAADADWCDLEPAIFGTLFEQALDPDERRQLGAHYTPRAYVERVVDATIIEPLLQDWVKYQSTAERALRDHGQAAAIAEITDFIRHLSSIRVLDPACGTGNFLYVSLRRLKQLEGEALKYLHDIGGDSAVAGVRDISVKPEQFFGIELNRRAVEIAELVLWIGYIQWHMRTRETLPTEPVLGSSDHVQAHDALMTWDNYPAVHLKRDATGRPVIGPQGQEVHVFPGAERPAWPEADFIVGNPPFIGGKDLRGRLRAGYAEALWKVHPHINPSADFVMHWWDRAAELLTREGTRLRRFGFVTTNSITQVFQRRVIERHLSAASPLSLVLAIPDHPWTKAGKDAAAVRIAITVATAGEHEGTLRTVVSEDGLETDEPKIVFAERTGRINADLTIGTDLSKASALLSNEVICYRGVQLMGNGFIVSREKAAELGLGRRAGLEPFIKPYRNGRDLTAQSRDVMVIDLFGLEAETVRRDFPEVYQHLLETVKTQRSETFAKSPTRDAQEYLNRWWQFGKPRQEMRPAIADLNRYIATVETAKHRVFQFLDAYILPDNMLVAIADDSAFHLGVLSSKIHTVWASHAGGTLEDRPRYSKSRCFDPFPFPGAPASLRHAIAELADELDTTRKQVLTENPDLTLTMLYNLLEASLAGAIFSAKDRDALTRGRVLILRDLHDRIDTAVIQAYGWSEALSEEEIISRLVELNQMRAKDEQTGLIRWLRPDYQMEKIGPLAHKADKVQSITTARPTRSRPAFPADRRAQAGCVLQLLNRTPQDAIHLATRFKPQADIERNIEEVLASLGRLGEIETFDNGRSYVRLA